MRWRVVLGAIGGVVVAMLVGLVPAEFIGWLREWSGRGGPDEKSVATGSGKRSRARRKGLRSRERESA